VNEGAVSAWRRTDSTNVSASEPARQSVQVLKRQNGSTYHDPRHEMIG